MVEEGGQQEEKLTHWDMPDDVLLSYFPEEVREEVKDMPMEEIREDAD